jgi:hypothetical protein
MKWGGSTNIASAYRNILQLAVTSGVDPKDMPKYLVIFSDMQFDQCSIWENNPRNNYGFHPSSSNNKVATQTGLDKMKKPSSSYPSATKSSPVINLTQIIFIKYLFLKIVKLSIT